MFYLFFSLLFNFCFFFLRNLSMHLLIKFRCTYFLYHVFFVSVHSSTLKIIWLEPMIIIVSPIIFIVIWFQSEKDNYFVLKIISEHPMQIHRHIHMHIHTLIYLAGTFTHAHTYLQFTHITCTQACTSTCRHSLMHTHARTLTHTQTHTKAYLNIINYTCACVCIYVYMHIYVCTVF